MSTVNDAVPEQGSLCIDEEKRNRTAAFTGHRSLPADLTRLKSATEQAVTELISKGVVYFECGGAVGYDTYAASLIIKLRDTLHPQLRLIQVLPFRGMESKWSPEQQKVFHEINERADKVVYLADRYIGNEQYHARNRYLVDHASHLVAYCLNTQARSGTASCFRHAVKQNKQIILIEG